MNNKKIEGLNNTIKALETSKFYSVNGWGIISFQSDISFVISRNSTCYLNGEISSKEASELIKELNEAISPILQKYIKLAKEQLKNCINEEI